MADLPKFKDYSKISFEPDLTKTPTEITNLPNFLMIKTPNESKIITSSTDQNSKYQITFADEKITDEILAETTEFFRTSLKLTYPELSLGEAEEITSRSITKYSFHPKCDNKFIFLKNINQKLVGLISFKLQNNSLYLNQIYLDEKLKGQGLGTKILQQILDSNPEAEIIELNVAQTNREAIGFYKMLGFVMTGEDVGSLNPGAQNEIKLIGMKVEKSTLLSKIEAKLSKK